VSADRGGPVQAVHTLPSLRAPLGVVREHQQGSQPAAYFCYFWLPKWQLGLTGTMLTPILPRRPCMRGVWCYSRQANYLGEGLFWLANYGAGKHVCRTLCWPGGRLAATFHVGRGLCQRPK